MYSACDALVSLSPGTPRGPEPPLGEEEGISTRIITQDPLFLSLLEKAKDVARTRTTVLIEGETGTGKELLAAYIHAHGRDPAAPYIALNCAALPLELAETELFGHEKGSFTGALSRKAGRFELAGKGTLVLDEISEMPLPIQAKLLRVLQEKKIFRIGGSKAIPIEARIIAISNTDLGEAVATGRFRQDLYYRIHVIPFRLPPLRARRGDIPLLCAHFLERAGRMHGQRPRPLSGSALHELSLRDWPGNVRELENLMERIVLCGETLDREPQQGSSASLPMAGAETLDALPVGTSMKEMERFLIVKTLNHVQENRTEAARLLGISIRTLRNKLREYRLHHATGL